jgi:hypothetical protein
MIKIHDLIQANNLLVSMGGDDQMPTIAAKSIEQSLELRHRIERALAYAESAPNASVHARNMARILDGSITVDDETAELDEHQLPLHPKPAAARDLTPRAEPPALTTRSKGKLKPGNGLAGRSTKQRLEIRAWIAQQGWEVAPSGRIPQKFIDLYDEAQTLIRKQRAEERKAGTNGASRAEQLGQLQLSQKEAVNGTLM